jgi:molybdopterin converting factor small subunit
MQVEVVVFATLRRFVPNLRIGESLWIEIEPGATFGDIRDQLSLPPEEVKIVMCNSLQVELTDKAQDGDRVAYIPAIAGG